MMDLRKYVGRKARLTGRLWGVGEWASQGAIVRIDRISTFNEPTVDRRDVAVVCLLDGEQRLNNSIPTEFAATLLPVRDRIWVYAYRSQDGQVGFDWSAIDRDPGAESALRDLLGRDRGDHKYGPVKAALVEVHLAGYAPDAAGAQRIVDMLDGGFAEAIVERQVGKIIDSFPSLGRRRWGVDVCVNVFGEPYSEDGTDAWAVYLDDPDWGAITDVDFARGKFPPRGGDEWVDQQRSEDDWLYGMEAERFLNAVLRDQNGDGS